MNSQQFYTNTDISLTPWQQECENRIVRNHLNELEAKLLRAVYALKHEIDSKQHWAGDNYSKNLSATVQEVINEIPLHPHP